jgi:hypothetical protein
MVPKSWPYIAQSHSGKYHLARKTNGTWNHDMVGITPCGQMVETDWPGFYEAPAFTRPKPFCKRCERAR